MALFISGTAVADFGRGADPSGGPPTSDTGAFQWKCTKMKELGPIGPAASTGSANAQDCALSWSQKQIYGLPFKSKGFYFLTILVQRCRYPMIHTVHILVLLVITLIVTQLWNIKFRSQINAPLICPQN